MYIDSKKGEQSMSNKTSAKMIAEATGRKAVMIARFDSTEDFEAVTKAKNFMLENGYRIGSMCGDEPMACAKDVSYIAKWRNIDIEEWPKVQAVIVSEDMRNGPAVECYEFV
jgi:hypothetical protein